MVLLRFSYLLSLTILVVLGLSAIRVTAQNENPRYKVFVSSIYDTTKFTGDLVSGEKLPVTLFGLISPNRTTDFGIASREYLKTQINKKNIILEVVREESDGKVIAIAYLDSGLNLNNDLLRRGWAFFDFYNVYYNRAFYIGLETDAKLAKLGIWGYSNLQIPDALKPLSVIKVLIGLVVSVYDGDTLTLQRATGEKESVRFHGIDCPERDQVGGLNARDFARSLVLNKRVTIEVTDVDRYGRNVGLIKTTEALFINPEMVRNGWCWHYKQYSKFPEWQDLEDKARESKIGIWGFPDAPLPPWEFRNGGSLTLAGPSYPTRKSGLLATDPDVEVFKGVITSVHDGDTFNTYHNGVVRRLRMYGIDAPEIKQLGGNLAQIFAQQLLQDVLVTVKVKAIDQYSRSVAIIVLPNGDVYNEKALENGFVWHYKSFSDDVSYDALEKSARSQKLGIWGLDGTPIAPWDWRNGVTAYTGV